MDRTNPRSHLSRILVKINSLPKATWGNKGLYGICCPWYRVRSCHWWRWGIFFKTKRTEPSLFSSVPIYICSVRFVKISKTDWNPDDHLYLSGLSSASPILVSISYICIKFDCGINKYQQIWTHHIKFFQKISKIFSLRQRKPLYWTSNFYP